MPDRILTLSGAPPLLMMIDALPAGGGRLWGRLPGHPWQRDRCGRQDARQERASGANSREKQATAVLLGIVPWAVWS